MKKSLIVANCVLSLAILWPSILLAAGTASWMGDNAAILSPVPLNQTAMVGAHDAGTYGIDTGISNWSSADLAPDVAAADNLLFRNAQNLGIVGKWAKTQDRTTRQMLDDGVRYFDIRVCIDNKGTLRTCHSIYGTSLDSILTDVKNFTDAHKKEIVILGFTHFWDAVYPKGQDKEGLSDADWTKLHTAITTKLKGKLIDGTKFSPKSTFQQIWAGAGANTSNQVIAAFDISLDASLKVPDPLIWHQVEAGGTWVADTDIQVFKSKTKALIDAQAHGDYADKFWAIRLSVTPDSQMIGRAFLVGGPFPTSNSTLADESNPVILGWLKNEWSAPKKRNVNLIWADHYDRSAAVKLALYLNGIPTNLPSSEIGTRTGWYDWNCPSDFHDDGLYCRKPDAYPRGAGYPWKFGDKAFSLDGARARCQQDHPEGCETNGAIIYPLCKSGFHNVGCCICSPNCPTGMSDIGVSCKK